ncbi:MAG: hypothetical protein U1F66_06870 [bacterium]
MDTAKFLRRSLLILSLLAPTIPVGAAPLDAQPGEEALPPLLEKAPTQAYEVLTPVGAGKKDLFEAREQLRREAAKAQAEAVILLQCEGGGMGRDGMVFFKKDAYCRGLAIRYQQPKP